MRSHRAYIAALVVLAVLFTAGPGAALFALPLVAIFTLLASGRYVGEERLIALHDRPARQQPACAAAALAASTAEPAALALREGSADVPRTARLRRGRLAPPLFQACRRLVPRAGGADSA